MGICVIKIGRTTPLGQYAHMSNFDELEEGEACDFCGNPISFRDDDWAVCPTCHAEYTNMDYSVCGDDL